MVVVGTEQQKFRTPIRVMRECLMAILVSVFGGSQCLSGILKHQLPERTKLTHMAKLLKTEG